MSSKRTWFHLLRGRGCYLEKELAARKTNERVGTCSSFHCHVKEAGIQVELSTDSQEWTPSHQHWNIHQYPKGQALESFWDAKCLEGGVSREVLKLGTYISPWALSSNCSPCQTLKKKIFICTYVKTECRVQDTHPLWGRVSLCPETQQLC